MTEVPHEDNPRLLYIEWMLVTGEESPADFAARIIPELRVGGYPNLAEHAEQHMAAPSGDRRASSSSGST